MRPLLGGLASRVAMVLPYARIVKDEQMCATAVRRVIDQLDPALTDAVRTELGFGGPSNPHFGETA